MWRRSNFLELIFRNSQLPKSQVQTVTARMYSRFRLGVSRGKCNATHRIASIYSRRSFLPPPPTPTPSTSPPPFFPSAKPSKNMTKTGSFFSPSSNKHKTLFEGHCCLTIAKTKTINQAWTEKIGSFEEGLANSGDSKRFCSNLENLTALIHFEGPAEPN